MILARHAEALFWAGRQLERTEHTTRVLDVAGRNAMHFTIERSEAEWARVLGLLGLTEAFAADAERVTEHRQVVRFLFADAANPGSVVGAAGSLRENIRTVRDRVPVELWEESNRLYLRLRDTPLGSALDAEPFELYSDVRRMCQAITGVVNEAMPRDEGYAFLRIGRMIERALMVCRLIRLTALSPDRAGDLTPALRMAASLQAFRRQHGYDHDPSTFARFLLRAETSPRSAYSCLASIEGLLTPLVDAAPGLDPARRIAGHQRAELEFGALEAELAADPIARVLDLEIGLTNLADTIALNAFDPAHSSMLTSQFVRPGTGPR